MLMAPVLVVAFELGVKSSSLVTNASLCVNLQ